MKGQPDSTEEKRKSSREAVWWETASLGKGEQTSIELRGLAENEAGKVSRAQNMEPSEHEGVWILQESGRL